MKLTLAFILALTLQTFAKGYSQSRITLRLESAELKKALAQIERKSNYRFLFSERKLPGNIKVNVAAQEEEVLSVLDRMLANTGLAYYLLDHRLIVIKPASDTQEQVRISGKITDASGTPIPGASVRIKGTTLGTTTDAEGNFSIAAAGDAVLQVSSLGYEPMEVQVQGRTTVNVTLQTALSAISEVVVVGYGTQKKVNLTGAVSAIDGKDINWRPVGQVSAALQGVAPGVTVLQSSGQPGQDQGTIRIRGIGTLNNNDPLVLVDGVQYNNINDVDANDIASFSILKDAAAASIYGVRAANGVILITTKRGATGKAKVSYSNYFGWQEPARLAKYVGAQEFMRLANLTSQNSGAGAIYSDAQIATYDDPNRNRDQYPDNYWLKDILTGSGFQQEHSLGVSGGTDNIKYHFSANYFDQYGLIKNMDYDRFTVRLNTDIKISSRLNFSADISTRLGKRQEPQGTEGSAWYQFGQAYRINPLTVNKYSDGTWGITRGDNNPIRLQEEGGLYVYKNNLFTGNFKANYTIIDGLTLTGMASVNYRSIYNSLHNKALDYFTDFPDNTTIRRIGQNNITKQYQGYWFRNFQGLAEYAKTINKHSFKVMGGISRLSETNDELEGFRTNLPNGDIEQIDAGGEDGQRASGTANAYNLVSFFGRLNYSFQDKYLLEANIRRDGSSRFADGQKWGWFPSFSAGWRISAEEFMKNVTFINDLKLRGSWGELGNDVITRNDVIDNYPYQSTYQYNSYPFGGTLYPAAGITRYPNAGLTWETTRMTDIGLDITLLKNLDITFDYYKKNTDNILLFLRIPPTVGLDPSAQNAGKVENTGWEFTVNYHGKIGDDFSYNVGGNLSDVKNKVVDLRGADQITRNNDNIYTGNITGLPIGGFFGYQVDGIFQTQEQVAGHAQQPFPATGPGDLIYRDQNNDKQVKEGDASVGGDMVYLGSNIPRYTYGVNLGASYKGFDLSTFFQGVAKVDIHTLVIEKGLTSTDGNFRDIHTDSWTPENTDASFPRLVTGVQNYQSSSYWVKSGAYLRLKSLQLGYTLPKAWLQKAGLSRCRLYVSGQNLLTFSGLPSDIDPEAPNDSRYYPQVRTYTFGLNVEF